MTATDKPFEARIERVNTWACAKRKLESLPPTWIFRGQSNSAHQLKTSLERASNDLPLIVAEFYLYQSFRRRAHHYLPMNLLPWRRIDWLSLMQHHGAPTRLLDWTRSPFVAAYFAAEKADTDWSIWAVDPVWCKEQGYASILKNVLDERPGDEEMIRSLGLQYSPISDNDYIENIFRWKAIGVFPVEPFWMNERMTIQQGLFLIPGNVGKTFWENLSSFSSLEAQDPLD